MAPLPEPPLPAADPPPLVRTSGGRRTLEFTPGEIQSEMLLARPHALVLAYSRAMMCFALFVPRPRHIVMVGLGGGSLAKFCYRHFPQARITVIELRADVIALRDQFHVPPDDARFTVIHADAAMQLARMPASADVLLVDGFDAAGLPAALCTARFFTDCRRALRDGGVLAFNLFSYDPAYDAIRARLAQAFGGHLCRFAGTAASNHILFGLRPASCHAGRHGAVLRRFRFLARRHGLGARWLNRALVCLLVRWLSIRPVPA